jgi:hypothetical protein
MDNSHQGGKHLMCKLRFYSPSNFLAFVGSRQQKKSRYDDLFWPRHSTM